MRPRDLAVALGALRSGGFYGGGTFASSDGASGHQAVGVRFLGDHHCSVDWTAVGTIIAAIALLATGVGSLLKRRADRRAHEPRIVFSDLYLAGPGEHPRDAYSWAIGVRLTNVGGGPALDVIWGYTDKNPAGLEVYSQVISRTALVPNDSTLDWSGLRGKNQEDEPTEAEAREFYERCIAFAQCWDSRGHPYLFSPKGGQRLRRKDVPSAAETRHGLSTFPSRGEERRALGLGLGDPERPEPE